MDKLWEEVPEWVPDFLNSLNALLAILLTLVVILAAVTRAPGRLWRWFWYRTRFHKRRVQSEILDQLAIGRPIQTVESVLGQPRLMNREHKQGEEWVEERIYRLPGAWVTVQAPDGVIGVYSITVTDRKLYYDTGPATMGIVAVRLGRDTFADARASDDGEAMQIYPRFRTFVRFYDYGYTATGGQYLWLAFNGAGAGKFGGGDSYAAGAYRYTHGGDGTALGTAPDYSAITVNTITVAGDGNRDHTLARGVHGPHHQIIRRG